MIGNSKDQGALLKTWEFKPAMGNMCEDLTMNGVGITEMVFSDPIEMVKNFRNKVSISYPVTE